MNKKEYQKLKIGDVVYVLLFDDKDPEEGWEYSVPFNHLVWRRYIVKQKYVDDGEQLVEVFHEKTKYENSEYSESFSRNQIFLTPQEFKPKVEIERLS